LRAASRHFPLLPILLAAGALRLFGLNWDDGHHLHPDERFIAIVESKIMLPSSIAEYFDTARSPLNPYNNGFDGFAYGTLPLFVARWLGEISGFVGYDGIVPLGRALSALADLGTVTFVYLLADLLFSRRAAVFGAVLSVFSVLHIQLSHFFAFDTFTTFFVAWSLYFAHRVWIKAGWPSLALLAVGVGFAVACKVSALTLLPVVVLGCLLPWPGRSGQRPLTSFGRLVAVGLVSLLAYRLAEPYAFLGTHALDFRPNPEFVADMLSWIKVSSGEVEVPYMIQWTDTAKYTFVLDSIVRWGLGPAAGLASLAGVCLAAYRLYMWRQDARLASGGLLLVWVVLNLVYFGGQFAKFMRYLLPVYPALAVMGGCFLSVCWQAAEEWWRRPHPMWRWAAGVAAAVPFFVVVPTVLWALAFVQVYARPNTRVTASQWLLEKAPSGAVLATEHWDDELPLALPGRERKAFRHLSMNLYDEERPEKLRKLVDNLNQSDYIILASNRLYGSIPRQPRRYPLATEYYRALFEGSLGYERVAEFTSRPNLLGFEIVDDAAQEDFTVYDHPKVLIFQRAPSYDSERVAAVLGRVPLDNVQRARPAQAEPSQAALLTSAEWAWAQAGGTWSELFQRDDPANRYSPWVWWVVGSLFGLLAWPLLWRLAPHLADGGYSFARMVGLLLVAYSAWLLASLKLLPFGRASLGLMLAALALVSAMALRGRWVAFRAYLRAAWPALVGSEAAFVAGFAICLGMRLVNPDLWHATYGGEKPMDFAYLNAVIKSDYFPPYDPWFAGGSINYYYFGFVLVAAMVKLSGIVPASAFNLALALWLGLVCQAAFGLGHNLLVVRTTGGYRRARAALAAGALAALLVGLVGNLDGALQVRDALWRAGGNGFQSGIPLLAGLVRSVAGVLAVLRGAEVGEFDFWRSTRLIGPEDPGPIHEFPFFSFLYGDLHAHLLALPLTFVVAGLALELSRSTGFAAVLRRPFRMRQLRIEDVSRFAALLVLVALLVGALRATNTWDFPTYLAVVLLGLACLFRPLASRDLVPALLATSASGAAVYLASGLLFAPYLARYQLFYAGVEPVNAHTLLWQFLTINGLFVFALASYLSFGVRRPAVIHRGAAARSLEAAPSFYSFALPMPLSWSLDPGWWLGALVVLAFALLLAALGQATLGLLLVLGVGLAAVAWLRWRSRETLFTIGLALLALGVLSLPEVLAIKGDVGRMNTVFKFYYQAWTLLAVISAVWLVRLLAQTGRRWPYPRAWRRLWLAALVVFLGATLIYPLRAAPSKLAARFSPMPPSLDGMAFMEKAGYKVRDRDAELPADYAALRWMQDNIRGSPVVLEANTGLYSWGSRVSIYTGLPSVIGWDWHQKQQRVAMERVVEERLRDVKTMYETPRLEQVLPLLRRYGVGYVYVGGLERIHYPAAGLKKFEDAATEVLEVVYQAQGVTIYRVLDGQ
jgi:YYY domain-containing protein